MSFIVEIFNVRDGLSRTRSHRSIGKLDASNEKMLVVQRNPSTGKTSHTHVMAKVSPAG